MKSCIALLFSNLVVWTLSTCSNIHNCEAFVIPSSVSKISCSYTEGSIKEQQQPLHRNRQLVSKRYFFNFGKPTPEESEKTKEESTEEKTKEEEKDGLEQTVENIFSVFFGKPEEEPMGLKRFGKERFPEQYPATIDEWADPVAGDDKEVALLRPMLKNTNLEERRLTLSYNANRAGWNAIAFHKAVDKKGPALVVCTTTDGLLCGGYNPKGWVGYAEDRGSIAAFLYVFSSDGAKITKLRKVGGKALAQRDFPEMGPQFGADSLIIPLSKDNPKLARSKLGSYYERFPDGTNSLFGKGKAQVQLKELKVYHGVWGPDEYVPFTDAEPFALY